MVYLVKFTNAIKAGYTSNLKQRLANLRNPKLLCVIEGGCAKEDRILYLLRKKSGQSSKGRESEYFDLSQEEYALQLMKMSDSELAFELEKSRK
jgi:hypothetical protein